MSLVTIEVNIDHGKVTPVGSQLLPEQGHGVLTVLSESPADRRATFSIGTGADGLPVIRGQGAAITSSLVREIEGFAA